MDMLIRLYSLPLDDLGAARLALGVTLRKPIGPEHEVVANRVAERFSAGWASEVRVALGNRPVSVWLAVHQANLLGFACYDATARGFVGPIGVVDAARGQGVGSALLRACLHEMRSVGYGYAIVGGVGAPEFFRRVAGGVEIEGSTPGLYGDQMRP